MPPEAHVNRSIALLAAVLPSLALAQPVPSETSVEAKTTAPAEVQGCLEHAVVELGLSPKRKDLEWTFGPEKLHPSIVPQGKFWLRLEKAGEKIEVRVTASWPGGVKPPAVQAELEQRLRSVAERVATVCGVSNPVAACQVRAGSAAPAACAAKKP